MYLRGCRLQLTEYPASHPLLCWLQKCNVKDAKCETFLSQWFICPIVGQWRFNMADSVEEDPLPL